MLQINGKLKRKLSLCIVFLCIFSSIFSGKGFAAITIPTPPEGFKESSSADPFEFMKGLGCVSGFPDGQPHLDETMTRAQLTAIMVKCSGILSGSGGASFPDVPDDHWAKAFIDTAQKTGWIEGFGDGNFHPDEKVTFGQLIKMVDVAVDPQLDQLQKLYKLKDRGNYEWPISEIKTAVDAGIVSKEAINLANEIVSRRDGFKITNHAFLTVPGKDGKTVYERAFGYKPETPSSTPPTSTVTSPPTSLPVPVSNDSSGWLTMNNPLTVIGDTYAQVYLDNVGNSYNYYVVIPGNAAAPAYYQVLTGIDSAGHPVSNSGRTTDSFINIQNLSGNTAYSVYIVGQDNNGFTRQMQNFRTLPPAALTVTNFVYGLTPNVTQGIHGFSVDFTLADTGGPTKLYYIFSDIAQNYTPEDVKAGVPVHPDPFGLMVFPTGNTTIAGNPAVFHLDNLAGSTPYHLYVVIERGTTLSGVYDFPIYIT